MNKNYTSIIVLVTILFFGALSAQETQKNFINYQGVARNASNELMAGEAMTIGVDLKFGTANASSIYAEDHSITTDANGVFSLLIGNGSTVNGEYNTLPWGSAATFVTVSMNGKEVGTTEMMSVPYAISSGKTIDQSAAEVLYDNSASGLLATTTQEAIDELMTGGSVDADSDPSNEFQTISFDSTTSELSLSDGNTIMIPTDGTDADADPTNEIQTISFDATSNKITLSDGGEITIPSGGTDADADPENEFQTLSFDVGTNELSLSNGNSITIPSGRTDADPDPENELQTLAFDAVSNELSLSDGNTITIPTGGVDGDGDSTNEIQTISFDAGTNELSLSDGGTVTIPSGGTDADSDPENEIDVTRRRGLLVGDDGIVDGLIGTADGQVAKWNAALGNWVAGTDAVSAGGGGATGFEALDEGSGIGWRLIDRNPANYGAIGLNALDASTNGTNSATRGATGLSATAMGEETTALGPRSTAMGYGTKATGSVSTAMGEETEASGEFSVAMGDRTLASEQSSTAFGTGTRATNTHATAMGESTTASGKSATAMGISTNAESLASLAVGRNNIGGGNPFVWQPNEPLFEVGNGSETVPNNALTVLKNGKVGVGTVSPSAMLQVEGNIRSSDLSGVGQRNVVADTDGNLVIGAGSSGGGVFAKNGNVISAGDSDDNFVFGSDRLDNDPSTSEDDSRMFFNKEKIAFRAGSSFGDNVWDDDNVGHFSVAFGRQTKASGSYSMAIGKTTEALGQGSTAMGSETKAFGSNSLAIGEGTRARAYLSTAIGRFNIGTASSETAWNPNDPLFEIGNGRISTERNNALTVLKNGNVGIGSVTPTAKLEVDGNIRLSDLSGAGQRNVMADADGNLVIGAGGGSGAATGLESITEDGNTGWRLIGMNADDHGDIGFSSVDLSFSEDTSISHGATGQNSVATGKDTEASGPFSTAMGVGTVASERASTAMGFRTKATGIASTSMGEGTEASGQWSTAMGKGTTASGDYSTAMGDGTTASGFKSTAMGFTSEAKAFASTAMGFGTETLGYYSTAMGFRTTTGTYASTAIGHYNVGGGGNTLAWEPTDPLFEIGNGEFGARRNALMVLKNGNMGVGNITPTTTLDIDGSTRIRDLSGAGQRNVMADAEGNLVIGSGSGGGAAKINDLLDGKSDPDGSSLFLGISAGTSDDGTDNLNVGVGLGALFSNTAGERNVAVGGNALYKNRTGDFNTATGSSALGSNISGYYNTASGISALTSNISGKWNTSNGALALHDNTADWNTANGFGTLRYNKTGIANTASGNEALKNNISGSHNVALGNKALENNTVAHVNTGIGHLSLNKNITGYNNTAVGAFSAKENVAGYFNTALGYDALPNNTSGHNNTAIGYKAAVRSGNSNEVRIGNADINYAAIQVAWTTTSDVRWKDDIKDLRYGLGMVSQLRPVDYIRKNNVEKTREIGFVAQEVDKVLSDLGYTDLGILTKDDQGFMSLRYNDFIPVIIKALQEQQEIIADQSETISNLKKRLLKLEKHIGE